MKKFLKLLQESYILIPSHPYHFVLFIIAFIHKPKSLYLKVKVYYFLTKKLTSFIHVCTECDTNVGSNKCWQ